MPAPYSYDLRRKVIEAIDDGMGKNQARKSSELVVIPLIYGSTKEKKQEIIERLMDTNEGKDSGQGKMTEKLFQ